MLRSFSSGIAVYLNIVSCVGFLLSSCRQGQNAEDEHVRPPGKSDAPFLLPEKKAAATTTYLDAGNQPLKVRAGKPFVQADSTFGGTPVFTNYGTEQGLPLSEISCSYTDSDGNLWFGTFGAGICRYDGHGFTSFATAQGLADNRINGITQDQAGNMWIGTEENGISVYDGKSFRNLNSSNGLISNTINSIFRDMSGAIWIGTLGGLSRFDGKRFFNYTIADGLAGNTINCVFQDKSGNLWFGSQTGASRFDGKQFVNYSMRQGLVDNRVYGIAQDTTGFIWFATYNGVSRFDGTKFTNFTTAQGLAFDQTLCIVADRFGQMWIGTYTKGLSRYDGKRFINYSTAQGLPSNIIQTATIDKAGNCWFGTIGGGLSRYDGGTIEDYTVAKGLPENQIYHILQEKSGTMWFGTDIDGASKLENNVFTTYSTEQGLPDNSVVSVIEDSKGCIWFSTLGGGVSRFDKISFTNYSKKNGLAGNNIWSMLEDRVGNLWFGSHDVGVSKFDGKGFTNYTKAQGLAGNTIYSMMQDKSGNIWFATGDGVSRFNGEVFTNFTKAQGLAANTVYSVIQDKYGNIWFGTGGGGITRYDGNSFTNYNTTQGLPDNAVSAIAEDRTRNLIWFGTNLGLSVLPSDHFVNPASGTTEFKVFDNNSGYPIKDINYNSLFVDNKGIVWAGCGDNKLIRFNYDAINKNSQPLKIQILQIKVNNESLCWNDLLYKGRPRSLPDSMAGVNEMMTTFGALQTSHVLDSIRKRYSAVRFDSVERFYPVPTNLVLPHSANNITIEYAATEPAMPRQVRYQEKLEGYDDDWTSLSNGTRAVFGHIPEGDYHFRIKALSPYGVWSASSYDFRVLPPWYRTWWAYSFYGICLLAALLLADRVRRERIIAREREKTKEKELEHAKEIERAYKELKASQALLIQSEKMASLGELTAGIAHEIQNPLNFVNNFSEINRELIKEMRSAIDQSDTHEMNAIADDIESNEEKINHHGKRAESIVKGMLQHTRTGTGQKEQTNFNALAEENLKLALHGVQAKNKDFNPTIKTDYDESLGSLSVVPQDLGRVFLNLYNNAFYSVNAKRKSLGDLFEPIVSVTTNRLEDRVTISVRDNGIGIPNSISSKIFQPFFTTKPTGQGTGLGLSLSYDIIKAHRGEITVVSEEGKFAEFIVSLPI